MKKALSLVLALVLCLSLCACSSNNDNSKDKKMSKEEMLASAQAVTAQQIAAESQNIAKAKQLYCGKIIELTGFIFQIEADFVAVSTGGTYSGILTDVYLPAEELVHLEPGQKIVVVGLMDENVETRPFVVAGSQFNHRHFTMKQAYLIQSTYKMTVTFKGSKGSSGSFIVSLPGYINSGYLYFEEGVDDSDIEAGDQLRIEAKLLEINSSEFQIMDATIVE